MSFSGTKIWNGAAALAFCCFLFLMAVRPAQGQTETVLYSFGAAPDGALPGYVTPIFDAEGNLYGTTVHSGYYYHGTAFELTPSGTEAVLWSFGNGTDGQYPSSGLVFDAEGNLYGTTSGGGAYGGGTVFELSPPSGGSGSWTETILHSFGAEKDGAYPVASLILDAGGNLYGTTFSGGAYGGGTVFELSAPAGDEGSWTETILRSFGNGTDGNTLFAGVVFDTQGNLYGTTYYGGAYYCSGYGCGTVFELSPPSGGSGSWTETILHSFGAEKDGASPVASLILDAGGNLYGTTSYGTGSGCRATCGVVFKVTPSGTETILHKFNFKEGYRPVAPVIMDADGNLYGTTTSGGTYGNKACDHSGCGTVFELTPTKKRWTETILHSFDQNGTDGINPGGGLVFDAEGNLYGTTTSGGAYSYGIVFKVTP